MNEYTPLSQTAQAIILGSLLGDGSLKIHTPYKNARFAFRHSDKQKDYFFWKLNKLKEISSSAHVWKQGEPGKKDGWGTVKWRYQSKAFPALTELFNKTHPKNKFKIKRKWLNLLTPLSLAIWWMDDGSIIANGRKGVLCTDGFVPKDVLILQQYLKVVWKIQTKAAPKSSAEPNRLRLWFHSSEQLQSFLRIILPYLKVEGMIHKFILLYHNHQLQQRWISEIVRLSGISEKLVQKHYFLKISRWKKYRTTENDIVQSV